MSKTINKEIFNNNSEKIDFSIDKNIVKLIAGVAVFSLAIYGGYDLVTTEKSTTPAPNPTEKTEIAVTGTGAEAKVPSEAKDFVEKYGNRYKDPVAVYYAEQAYIARSGIALGSTIDSGFINNFKINDLPQGDHSSLDFTNYLLVSPENTQKTAVEIFNTYTVKNMNIYMNLLARNGSSQKAIDMIDSEFENYCSDAVSKNQPKVGFSPDDEPVEMLISTMKNIVSKYGSTVNYHVSLGEIETKDKSKTSFPSTPGAIEKYKFNGSDITAIQSNGIRLVINIDIYNNKNELEHKTEVLEDVQLAIIRRPTDKDPNVTMLSIGQQH